MKKPKRECPFCGDRVVVVRTVTTKKTDREAIRYQSIECSGCKKTGVIQQTDRVEWD